MTLIFPDYMRNKIIKHCEQTINCDKKIFEESFESLNSHDKEKKFIYEVYYKFLDTEECVDFVSRCYFVFLKGLKLKEDVCLTLSIIILRFFLDRESLSDISEKYYNSDDVFYFVLEYFKYYLILSKKFMPLNSIKTTCLHALDLLVEKEIFKEKKIKLKAKGLLKTIKYYSAGSLNYKKNVIELMTFSYSSYALIEFDEDYYITSGHFFKTYELYRKNFSSNKGFKIKNTNYIMNKINIKLYVDKEYQDSLKNFFSIDKNEMMEEIQKNTLDINNLLSLESWTSVSDKEMSKLQSRNSKLKDLLIYSFFSEYDFGDYELYFPLFFDFRGRKYYHSSIGPTSSKLLRLSFYYGWYSQSDFKESNNFYSLGYYDLISLFCEKRKIINERKYYEVYFWVLIGISKFFVDKSKYPITVEEFLNTGIDNYDNENILKLENKLEVLHYKRIIESLKGEKIKKRTIIKDATASINQIFMKKLGPLDQSSMDFVNLGNKWEWYDTYTVCKDLFYESLKRNSSLKSNWTKEEFDKVLKRPLIKDPIMKIPYSAGNKLCWENYVDIIKEKKYDIKIDTRLKKLMWFFYNFIREDMQEFYLYNKTSTSLMNKISENFEMLRKIILESETGQADISYYKMKRSSIDKKYQINGEKKRITKLVLVPSKALDKKTFDIAVGANTVHFLDADEIRLVELNLGYSVITIHDSYLIDFNKCSSLIKIKMDHYQKEIDKIVKGYEVNNIFILL